MAQFFQKIEKFWDEHHVGIAIASSILLFLFSASISVLTSDDGGVFVGFIILFAGTLIPLTYRDEFVSFGMMFIGFSYAFVCFLIFTIINIAQMFVN